MRIQLIRTSRKAAETGIGHYSDLLETELKEMEYDVESIAPDFDTGQGFKGLIVDNIICPIITIIRGRRHANIVHATAEPYALFLPFAKAKRI